MKEPKVSSVKILELADLMIDYNWTVRQLSSNVDIPITSVWRYVTKWLRMLDDERYVKCQRILSSHRRRKY